MSRRRRMPALGEGRARSMLSAHDDGAAYAAIDGHRIDDFQPHVLRTHDCGAELAGDRRRACRAIISSTSCAPIR